MLPEIPAMLNLILSTKLYASQNSPNIKIIGIYKRWDNQLDKFN